MCPYPQLMGQRWEKLLIIEGLYYQALYRNDDELNFSGSINLNKFSPLTK